MRALRRFLRFPREILNRTLDRRLRAIQDEDLSISAKVKRLIKEDPSFSARFSPYLEDQTFWIIPKWCVTLNKDTKDGFPVPPNELWAGYGENSEAYLSSGKTHFEAMKHILEDSGFSFEEGGRILDFGCAAGRMIRCLKDLALKYEIWGVDVMTGHILWCQQYLSPPFKFATTTTFPHLPFEDNYFNLIYACSIFTHICDLAETWLLELRRVLRPGGKMYITVHDNHSIDLLLSSPPGHWLHDTLIRRQLSAFEEQTDFLKLGFSMFTLQREPGNAQVFHDIDFLCGNWGRFLQVVSVVPEAYGYQTAITLEK